MSADEPYVRRSVKDLAAGLNHTEVGRVPVTSKPAKPLPTVKPKIVRSVTVDVPTGPSYDTGTGNQPAAQEKMPTPTPRLPPRRPTNQSNGEIVAPSLPTRSNTENVAGKAPLPGLPARRPTDRPALPARQPSGASTISSISDVGAVPTLPARRPTDVPSLPDRRKSQSSVKSDISVTGTSRVKAPEYDPSKLPPLPTKRSTQDSEVVAKPPPLPGRGNSRSPVPPPSRTPKLPERSESVPAQPPRRLPPRDAPAPRPSPLTNGTSGGNSNGTPPPIPTSTRPDLSKIMANKPKYTPTSSTQPVASSTECLLCRDFSGPDNHAARFPSHTVQSIAQLARDLTGPFYSPTDKARAIFAWMHHNIAYDCDAFFNNSIRAVTPMDTIRKGAGVCSGYADLYADIALQAGLECVVVSGHGKGYGYEALQPGEPVPPEEAGHAWNAVKIDMGGPYGNGHMYWKLIDACWGAGNVGDDKQFHKDWTPHEFTKSNEDFGRTHWPTDRTKFFRADGRSVPWAEYYIGDAEPDPVQVFSVDGEGIDRASVLPKQKKISVDPSAHANSNGKIRFQFNRICEHWKPEIHGQGKDYVYALACGVGKWIPFQCNGFFWWCDVPVDRLGKRGEGLNLWLIKTINGQDGRGVTQEEYMQKQGRSAMGFDGLARWDLV